MSGGMEELVVNPNERALSIDQMRMQRFKGADLAELWRAMVDTLSGTDDLDANGLTTQITTTNDPLTAEILGGLTVLPQIGVLDLLVAPGTAFLLNPDSPQNPDESIFKYVRDPGIASTGILQMTANSSGQTRIDVIECARVAGGFSVLETDNRDIFNPVTGLFSPSTVNKVTAGRLQYRVRAGTPGAGYPGPASGWLPLAIASVPSPTTSNDQITFWDVRPLVADRVRQPFATTVDQSTIEMNHFVVDSNGHYPGRAVITGVVRAVATNQVNGIPGQYRLGGRLRTGAPTADLVNLGGGLPDGFDLNAAANQSGTWSVGQPVYLYLLEPFLLPRWARYSDVSTGSRVPRSPRGIPVVSPIAPAAFYGCPSAGIALPALFGMGATVVNKGICIAALIGDASNTVDNLVTDGKTQWSPASFGLTTVNGTITGTTGVVFAFTPGTHYPAHAKRIKVAVSVAWSGTAGLAATISTQVEVAGSGGYVYYATPTFGGAGSPYGFTISPGEWGGGTNPPNGLWAPGVIDIPVLHDYAGASAGSAGTNLEILWNASFSGGTLSFANAKAQVVGWDL